MSITAYLYHRNQTPCAYQAECKIVFDLVEGDIVSIPTGHEIFDEFRVAACDGETALLVSEPPF